MRRTQIRGEFEKERKHRGQRGKDRKRERERRTETESEQEAATRGDKQMKEPEEIEPREHTQPPERRGIASTGSSAGAPGNTRERRSDIREIADDARRRDSRIVR